MVLAALAGRLLVGRRGIERHRRQHGAGTAALVEGLPGDLTINQMQVMGSHNSYHVAPTEEQLVAIAAVDEEGADSLDYGHAPLHEQFTDQGIRQIELDIYADTDGGLYAEPTGAEAAGYDPAEHPEMLEPGFKVLHIPDIDFSTTCTTFVLCLEEVAAWSEANPDHLPIAVLVEAKSDATYAEPFTPASFDALDEEIRSVFGEDQIITPDDVRGDRATLEEAVLEDGWPTLGGEPGPGAVPPRQRGRGARRLPGGPPRRWRAGCCSPPVRRATTTPPS